ncbi:MAG: hypothetical protein U0797_29560 [Gemmataceae bacterium]
MRCPSCQADNPPTATACSGCQAPMTPRRRRRSEAAEDSPKTEEYNRQVRNIFRVCLLSMVPLLGLVLGPLSAARAWRFLHQARTDPAFQAEHAAKVVVAFGLLTGVTNWLGLALILLGLYLP